VNISHKILDWFGHLRGVIDIHQVLMYYAIEIGYYLFLSEVFSGCFLPLFFFFLNVDLSSLFIVEKPPHRV
jgi:hypothetical protein